MFGRVAQCLSQLNALERPRPSDEGSPPHRRWAAGLPGRATPTLPPSRRSGRGPRVDLVQARRADAFWGHHQARDLGDGASKRELGVSGPRPHILTFNKARKRKETYHHCNLPRRSQKLKNYTTLGKAMIHPFPVTCVIKPLKKDLDSPNS